MGVSAYLKGLMLGAALAGRPFEVNNVYVSLHSGIPDGDGLLEVEGGGYRRHRVTQWAVGDDGAYRNGRLLDFTDMPAVTVVGLGLWDAPKEGNFLWGGVLAEAKLLNDNDIFRLSVERLRVDLVS